MASPTAIQTSKLLRNSRRLAPPSQAQVDDMAESIRDLGMIAKPIDVRRVGDGYEIVDAQQDLDRSGVVLRKAPAIMRLGGQQKTLSLSYDGQHLSFAATQAN